MCPDPLKNDLHLLDFLKQKASLFAHNKIQK